MLSEQSYLGIMKKMIKKKRLNIDKLTKNIFFSKENLIKLSSEGHIIGLHSHSHPLDISKKAIKNNIMNIIEIKLF